MKLLFITALLGCIIATGAASQYTTTTEAVSTTSQDTTSAESTAGTTVASSSTESLKQISTEEQILHLMTEHTTQMLSSNKFLSEIESAISLLSFNVQEQIDLLPQLNLTQQQFSNTSRMAQNQTELVVQTLNNTAREVGSKLDRTVDKIECVMQEQEVIKEQIKQLQDKLNSYQQKLLKSTQSLDNNLLQLTELVTRAVLPRIHSLNSSFSSLNHSHSNINLELENVARIKAVQKVAVGQLNHLDLQLAYLNLTQNSQLSSQLTEASKYFCPEKVKVIDKGLQDLIVAQKRILTRLTECEEKRIKPKSYELTNSPKHIQIYKSANARPQLVQSYKTTQQNRNSQANLKTYSSANTNPNQLSHSKLEYYVYDKTPPTSQSDKAYSNGIIESQPNLKSFTTENTATTTEQKSTDYYINDMPYVSKSNEHDQDAISETKEYKKKLLPYDFIKVLETKLHAIIKPDAQLSKPVEIYNGKQRQSQPIYENYDVTSQNQAIELSKVQNTDKYIYYITNLQDEQLNDNYKNPQFKSRRIGNTYYGNGYSDSYAQVPQS